jgi:hypothetical protein
MKTFKQLKKAITNKTPLVWNDPDPIKGTDYTITFIEDLSDVEDDEDARGYPILIQYGGSEAQVFLFEILIK